MAVLVKYDNQEGIPEFFLQNSRLAGDGSCAEISICQRASGVSRYQLGKGNGPV